MDLASERLESVKAGTIAALSASGFDSLVTLVASRLPIGLFPLDRLAVVHVVITGFSGFLFGVTYRYVVRTDRNVHLGQGAILAFGLVRGLSVLEPRLVRLAEGLAEGLANSWGSPASIGQVLGDPMLPIAIESAGLLFQAILPFAGAAAILGVSLQRRWLQPCSTP
jgi:hypothetical protein